MLSVKKSICLTRGYGVVQISYVLKIGLLENYLFLPQVGLTAGNILQVIVSSIQREMILDFQYYQIDTDNVSHTLFFSLTLCSEKIWFSKSILHDHTDRMSLIQKLTLYHLCALNAKNIQSNSGECAPRLLSLLCKFEISVFSRHCDL